MQAIPKLFPADYTLDDSMDASWTPRAGAGDSWRSASVETWVARCALLFLLNSNMGLTFKNAVRANALWAVLCLPEMAAWEWGWGAVKEARTLGITSLLLVQALTLVACYLRDKSLRLHMVKVRPGDQGDWGGADWGVDAHGRRRLWEPKLDTHRERARLL